ncbi:MAG: hypothetical protein HQK83_00715 [Fibrobacteria bacterium]|nr:hypothetical protein [Fibrobacteria bacterium]
MKQIKRNHSSIHLSKAILLTPKTKKMVFKKLLENTRDDKSRIYDELNVMQLVNLYNKQN